MTKTATKEPWQMTLAEFLASKTKVTRNFCRFSTDERTVRASSQRMGHRQREAVGEYFYTNDTDNNAYPTAKAAKVALHRALIIKAWQDGFVVPQEAMQGHYGLKESLLPA